jgi:TPR repeat protein
VTPEQTTEYKRRFARALVQGKCSWDAICIAIPDSTVDRAFFAVDWPHDTEVAAIMREIQEDEEDPIHGLPSKADFDRLLWEKMQDADPSDCAKLAKVYADVRGWTKKPIEPTKQNDNTVPTVHVMMVPHYPSAADWERAAQPQQANLIAEGREIAESTTH